MEIEEEQKPTSKKESPEDSQNKLKYLSQMLGIKLKDKDMEMFPDINDLYLCISGIKFTDKKKTEIKENISESIKKVSKKETLEKFSEEKTKKFSDIVKLNGKTTIYHTVDKKELSQTMGAFYFSDKSKQVFSDKQTAEYKAMHFNPGYELTLEPALKTKEEESSGGCSDFKGITTNVRTNDTTIDNKLKKKRKSSTNFGCKTKNCKKKRQEKTTKSEEYNNNKANDNDLDGKEEVYCIEKCIFNRRSKGQPMIQCDQCWGWYHFKCLSITKEQFLKYDGKDGKGKPFYCPSCVGQDMDDKKIIDGLNNSSKN